MVAIGLSLLACTPTQFKITRMPQGVSPEQSEKDSLSCRKENQRSDFGVWGVDSYNSIRMAASQYDHCMNNLGYEVEEQY